MIRLLSIGLLLVVLIAKSMGQSPVAVDDSVTTPQNTPVDIHVLANDFDPDGDIDSTSISLEELPTLGTAQVDTPRAVIVYTPDTDQRGRDSLKYRIMDIASNQSNVATVYILVNNPPFGFDAFLTTPVDSPLVIVVTDYFFDSDGFIVAATIVITQQPAKGITAIDDVFGEITYNPDSGVRGLDSLRFTVSDNDGSPGIPILATITINNPPVTLPDSAITGRNTPVVIDILANDSDSDGFLVPASVGSEVTPEFGAITLDTLDGSITYTPDSGFVGIDVFDYFVVDNDGGFSDLTPVTVRVLDADPPLAVDDEVISLGINTPVTLNVFENDSTRGIPLVVSSLTLVSTPANGQATVDAVVGNITYQPDPDYEGPETFSYTVQNDSGLSSNPGEIILTVRSEVNDSAVVLRDSTAMIDVIANDEVIDDFPPDPATVVVVDPPSNGSVTFVNTTTGELTYQPDPGFSGVDSLIYSVESFFEDLVAVATVKLHVRIPPLALDDSVSTGRNTSVSIPVLSNDAAFDGALDSSTVAIVSLPQNGEAVPDSVSGQIAYFPNFDFFGTDSLRYSVKDNYGVTSNEAVVMIRVLSLTPPVAVDDLIASLGMNTPVTIDILENDSTESSSLVPSSVNITRTPTLGSATINMLTGSIRYVPNPDEQGPDTLAYTVENDSGLVSNSALVTLTLRAGVNDLAVTFRDSTVTHNVIANDSVGNDFIPDPATLVVLEPPFNGVISAINTTTGSLTYVPNPSFTGRDSLIYKVEDGFGTPVAVATFTTVVRPPNQPPVAMDDYVLTRQNSPVMIAVLANDMDPDGDALTLESIMDPVNGTALIIDDSVRYTPDMNFVGLDSLQYVVHDGFEGRDTATVGIEVIILAYDITDLGTLGGALSRGYAVNDSNQVVGASITSSGHIRAFRWESGTLAAIASPDTGATLALGINAAGWIVGAQEQNGIVSPVVWRNDTLTVLGGLGGNFGTAYSVNSSGVIVGSSSDGSHLKAFSWEQNVLTGFDANPRTSEAFSVNAQGEIAGYVAMTPLDPRAARGSGTTGWTWIDGIGGMTRLYAVNDSGYAAGSRQSDTLVTAVLWSPSGQETALPGLQGGFSEIYGLSFDGLGVGASGSVEFTAVASVNNRMNGSPGNHFAGLYEFARSALAKRAQNDLKAAVWIRGAVFDLNDAIPTTGEWTLLEARGLNRSLNIVGTGIRNGQVRAFLLTPSTNQPPVALNVSVRTLVSTSVILNVLAGSRDPDGEIVKLVHVSDPRHGSVEFEPGGTVTYTPMADFVGVDSLTFIVSDRGAFAQGMAIVTVSNRPVSYELHQNYPNPFNPTTNIAFVLPSQGVVRLDVFDILGRRVATVLNEVRSAGTHEVLFSGGRLSTGVYLYRLQAGSVTITRKLILLK